MSKHSTTMPSTEPGEQFDDLLDLGTEAIVDALIASTDGHEEAAIRRALEAVLAEFGVRRG